jgi:site-specific DNA recombinase
MLKECNRRRRERSTVENGRLGKLNRELGDVEAAQQRLLDAVEKGLLPHDETLRKRAHANQSRRQDILLEIARSKDRQRAAEVVLDNNRIALLCNEITARFSSPSTGLGKAWLRLVVSEIRLEGSELKIIGSYDRLAQAYGMLENKRPGEVPSLISDWRARHDSNVRPLPSEGSTLSN